MLASFVLALVTLNLPVQQPACIPGQVVQVDRGKDYTITLCGGAVIALRGVEAPLHSADVVMFGDRGGRALFFGGELLGGKDITNDALRFLSGLVVGKKVTLVFDGYRIGDYGGRTYAYVYLAGKTLVNAEMIRRGFGYAEVQGAHPMRDRFIALEAAARREKVGLWSS